MKAEDYPLDYPTLVPDEFNGLKGRTVDFLDIGCGFGGLLCRLMC